MLGEVGEVRVGGHLSAGRPRKNWNNYVMMDLNLLGVDEHAMQDQWMWRVVIPRSNPILDGKMWTLNENDDDDNDVVRA